MKRDADDEIARLLRGRIEPGPPAGSCLDAESAAAWFDGTLTAAQQRQAESHVSTCARCQALLATMAQIEPIPAAPRRGLSLVRWLAPALVAATAVLVWFNVTRKSADVRPVPASVAPVSGAATSAAQEARAPQAAQNQPAAAPSLKPVEKRAAPLAVNESVRESKEPSRKTLDARADASESPAAGRSAESGAAASSVPPTANRQAQLKDEAGAAQERDALMAPAPVTTVRSPEGPLWRIARDGTVSRSTDNGTTWREQALGSSAHLLAGSSPSANVVWFAGAGGSVVMTTDGVSWQWRPLPERVDLTGIAAADGQTATVTTRDGRRFVTHDGGLTWVPAPVQENSAAPF